MLLLNQFAMTFSRIFFLSRLFDQNICALFPEQCKKQIAIQRVFVFALKSL
jgi:hypothetical protein